ncbi:Nif11-like leader peptide family natural product precursor [Actinomadura harenae]|uniref:Nif11 family protein n=1 Tax=Actinomadura harenae TaxID=2483351 RepID=A0A3M2M3G5_9ACTN|nr:Nif11-like leader peptide family natural product precursor [Actinomadura harenae]RMI41668.1 Nif11 family protein [Actinomadura harenae]
MSVDACQEFMNVAGSDPDLTLRMRAMTGVEELLLLARGHGYEFTVPDLAAASRASALENGGPAGAPAGAPGPGAPDAGTTAGTSTGTSTNTKVLHTEYALDDLPGFGEVLELLPRVKIRPPSVDMDRFADAFVPADLASTEHPPSGPEYRRWRAGLKPVPGDRRDFHLVNLDDHVAHPGYESYLDAKVRLVRALEGVFGPEVRFSGSMWYPPSSYRLWHTNEDQPGWRMYLIDFDDDFDDPSDTSFFRYQTPGTDELVTLRERPRMARFFKIEQEPERLFWHCIVNPTERHRWSFGFVVPDDWKAALEAAA